MNPRALARPVTQRPIIARWLALAAVAALCGCISLFPKTAPSQLYRFDANVQAPTASGPPVAIRQGATDFDPAAGGDRILTVTGDQVAYIQDARWAIPASELFQQALERGLNAPGGPTRLVDIGEGGQAKYRLRLQVTHFEARYLGGDKAAPTVFVTVRATLDRQDNGALVAEHPFEASVAAGDNRVGAIVEAYDAAVSKVVGDLAAWVAQTAA
jgi:cholesterol transport system auxiliary component